MVSNRHLENVGELRDPLRRLGVQKEWAALESLCQETHFVVSQDPDTAAAAAGIYFFLPLQRYYVDLHVVEDNSIA